MKSAFSFAFIANAALVLGLSSCAAAQLPAASATSTAPAIAQPSAIPAVGPTGNPQSELQNGDPALTIRSDKAAADSEPAANEEYTLGAGDQISLDFPGRPELTGKSTIGPDGRITLPLIEPVHVAGLTRTEAGKAIVAALSTYYIDLTVTVGVEKYTSNHVRVLGYVQHPGDILFDDTPTLLNAISRAGIITPTVSKEGVTTVIGSGIPEICTIYRGNNTAYQVQLRTLLMSGNALADMRLRRNDIVYVPEPKEVFVSVLGEVTRPGTIPLTPASTLQSVLAEAGCCSEGGGFSPEVRIIQPSIGKVTTVKYKDLISLAGQTEYTLHSGDVILIPKSGFFKASYIFQRISPVTSMVGLAAVAAF
jgi:polysaccharide export outer membrane protein